MREKGMSRDSVAKVPWYLLVVWTELDGGWWVGATEPGDWMCTGVGAGATLDGSIVSNISIISQEGVFFGCNDVHALDAQRAHDLHGALPLLHGEERLHLHADLDDLHRVGGYYLIGWVVG